MLSSDHKHQCLILCKRKYGGIESFTSSRECESMYRLDYCYCPTCHCYYDYTDISKTNGFKIKRICPCCKTFLKFKFRNKKNNKKHVNIQQPSFLFSDATKSR